MCPIAGVGGSAAQGRCDLEDLQSNTDVIAELREDPGGRLTNKACRVETIVVNTAIALVVAVVCLSATWSRELVSYLKD